MMKPLLLFLTLTTGAVLLLGPSIGNNLFKIQELSETAMAAKAVDTNGNELSLKDILRTASGKPIVVDVWATWCRDCIVGIPKVEALQAQFDKDEYQYLFLSVDKEHDAWLNGLKKYNLQGMHFRLLEGWESPFCKDVGLDWIPRYMVIDRDGNVMFHKATTADAPQFTEFLNSLAQ